MKMISMKKCLYTLRHVQGPAKKWTPKFFRLFLSNRSGF